MSEELSNIRARNNLKEWFAMKLSEFSEFLGILRAMGRDIKPSIGSYWEPNSILF